MSITKFRRLILVRVFFFCFVFIAGYRKFIKDTDILYFSCITLYCTYGYNYYILYSTNVSDYQRRSGFSLVVHSQSMIPRAATDNKYKIALTFTHVVKYNALLSQETECTFILLFHCKSRSICALHIQTKILPLHFVY